LIKFLEHCIHFIIIPVSMFGFGALADTQEFLRDPSPNFRHLIKLISLNEQIDFSSLDTFRVGILTENDVNNFTSSNSDSVFYAFSEFLKNTDIQSKPMKICSIQSDGFTVQNLSQLQCVLINYKCESILEQLLEICRKYNVLSFTFDSVYVTKGVSVGIFPDHNNIPKTLINWDQFQEEEWGLGAQILQFAKIYQIND